MTSETSETSQTADLSRAEETARARRRTALRTGLLLAAVILAATGVTWGFALLAEMPLPGFELSEAGATERIRSMGMWGVAATIGLMVIHSFVPFPAEFVALAAGMVYGPVWGTVITWTGAMLGALLSFGLARWLGRPFIEAVLPERHWTAVDAWTERQGASTLLISRLIPVIAFNLINYAAGLTRLSWFTFIWATGIGILPLTALMVAMGVQMRSLPWWALVAITVAAIALWFLWRALRGRLLRT